MTTEITQATHSLRSAACAALQDFDTDHPVETLTNAAWSELYQARQNYRWSRQLESQAQKRADEGHDELATEHRKSANDCYRQVFKHIERARAEQPQPDPTRPVGS